MLEKGKFTEIDEEFICENCGKKVKKLEPIFRILPSVMIDRSDAQVYFKQDIPLSNIHVEIIVHIVCIQNMLIKILEIGKKCAMET